MSDPTGQLYHGELARKQRAAIQEILDYHRFDLTQTTGILPPTQMPPATGDTVGAVRLSTTPPLDISTTAPSAGVGPDVSASDHVHYYEAPTELPPTGAAGGDLSGTYPDPVVNQIDGTAVDMSTPPITHQVLKWNGSAWIPNTDQDTTYNAGTGLDLTSTTFSVKYGTIAGTAAQGNDARLSDSRIPTGSAGGDLTGSYPNPILTTTGVSAATYGDSTHVSQFTVDAKGRVTGASNVSIAAVTPAAHQISHQSDGSDPLVGNIDAAARVGVRVNSTGSTYKRRRLNLIPGSDITISHADDSGNEEVDITIGRTALGVWSPDYPPLSPSAIDDEFNDSSLSGSWTEFDVDNVLTVTEESWGLQLAYNAANGTHALGGIYRAVPSGDYCLITKISLSNDIPLTTISEEHQCGLFIAENASANNKKFLTFAVALDSTQTSAKMQAWTNYATKTALSTQTTILPGPLGGIIDSVYLRVRYTSGNLYADVSRNGLAWSNYVAAATPAFTPAHVGLFISSSSGDNQPLAIASFFRKTTDVGTNQVLLGSRR